MSDPTTVTKFMGLPSDAPAIPNTTEQLAVSIDALA
jgi:hypothetical protein